MENVGGVLSISTCTVADLTVVSGYVTSQVSSVSPSVSTGFVSVQAGLVVSPVPAFVQLNCTCTADCVQTPQSGVQVAVTMSLSAADADPGATAKAATSTARITNGGSLLIELSGSMSALERARTPI